MPAPFFIFIVLSLFVSGKLISQPSEIYTKNEEAISGYDPVAYFELNEPIKGNTTYKYQWKGVNWLFQSEIHLEKFKATPEAYAPQFGGYCAYAVANGYTAKSDPRAWKIVDGKLYLNYNKGVQKKWEKDQSTYIAKGETNWPAVLEP